jgi:hypothetical protein
MLVERNRNGLDIGQHLHAKVCILFSGQRQAAIA